MTDTTDAATTEPYDVTSYQFNHPKNYLGYAIALSLGGSRADADRLTEQYVVGTPNQARRGAQNLDLVAQRRVGQQYSYELTDRGQWVTSSAPVTLDVDDDLAALELFDDLRGARARFCDEYPRLRRLGPHIARGDDTIARFLDYLTEIEQERRRRMDDCEPLTTNELFMELWERDARFAGDFFIRDHDGIRTIVLGSRFEDYARGVGKDPLDIGQVESIEWGEMPHDGTPVYRSPVTYQLHNLLWHLGVLESKGTQATNLDARELTWQLTDRACFADPEPTDLTLDIDATGSA